MPDTPANQLFFGDNLTILREHVPDASVDLIYLDPPFNSKASYNILFREKSGSASAAQITAFDDTWHWDTGSEWAYTDTVRNGPSAVADLLQVLRRFLGQNDMMAYLTMMTQRMIELRRVLKSTGSIYLHCDPTASHYLRLMMDACFGVQNFRNEISWKRTGAHSGAKRWGRIHDSLLFYTASDEYTWNEVLQPLDQSYIDRYYVHEDERGRYRHLQLMGPGTTAGESGQPWRGVDPTESGVGRHWAVPRDALEEAYPDIAVDSLSSHQKLDLLDEAGLVYWPPGGSVPQMKHYLKPDAGLHIQDIVTDIPPVSWNARDWQDYPTQKPVALLDRILQASSNEGDVVLDPFCGCGTALASAEGLNRQWIGIDITHLAIALIRHRLTDTFGEELSDYTVHGEPEDVASAEALALQNRHQFEWWALSLVDAIPANDKKRGPDGGIDGYINFFDDNSGTAKKIVVQVKSGKVARRDISELKGSMEREEADLALFVTLKEPTAPMSREAVTAGFYEPECFPGQHHPRVQVLTIAQLLSGTKPSYPRTGAGTAFRKAKRRRKPKGSQGALEG